jgi:hypothetical protein
MRLLRARIRSGAVLALFALAVQFVAAFGHIHKEDFARIPSPGSAAFLATAAEGGRQVPVPPSHDDHDLVCSICASISLAGTLLLPAPPAILVLLMPAETLIPAPAATIARNEERRGFQARAPPA